MASVGPSYGALRLRETSEFIPDEAFVQRLWFEQLFKNPLTTTDGRKIHLHQPGFWNRGPGPDFIHAAAEIPGVGVIQGPVEIHLTPDGFTSHGHHKDPAYQNLLLHAVWMRGLSGPPPLHRDGSPVPVVELCHQLRVPLTEAKSCFAAAPSELEVGARLGRCQKILSSLPDKETNRLVEEAGWFRFHQRCSRWKMRRRAIGDEESLWQGLAEVLGYSKNREAMVHLSRLLPIKEIQSFPGIEREALLFGHGGWLEMPASEKLSAHIRSLWDIWWKHRDESKPHQIDWTTGGLRPANRPERRLAALAWLGNAQRFHHLLNAVQEADTEEAKAILLSCSHPEWDHRCSLQGKRTEKANRLIGQQRIDAFLFNVFWPMAYAIDPDKVEQEIKNTRTAADSLASRRTRVRLLDQNKKLPWTHKLIAVEGLLQIYRDFCLEDRSGCGQCDFPEWVQLWRQG